MSETSTDTQKGTAWVQNFIGFLCLIILIGGGLAFEEGFFGILWLLIKWVLSFFAVAAVLVICKAPPKSPTVQAVLNTTLLIAAILVLMLD